ncbi:MAG: hypothetical protein AABW88_04150 [Nanoarchaeota archaeon]
MIRKIPRKLLEDIAEEKLSILSDIKFVKALMREAGIEMMETLLKELEVEIE